MLLGFTATMEVLTSADVIVSGTSNSLRPSRCPSNGPGLVHPADPSGLFPNTHSLSRRQISLLIAFELPTIPPPTTTLPFRCDRFSTSHHRRSLSCLSLGLTSPVDGIVPSHDQGFEHSQESPRQAWPKRVRLRYGLVIHLRLLSTLPHGNAVTIVGYRAVTSP
jgi:hypothetical protein